MRAQQVGARSLATLLEIFGEKSFSEKKIYFGLLEESWTFV